MRLFAALNLILTCVLTACTGNFVDPEVAHSFGVGDASLPDAPDDVHDGAPQRDADLGDVPNDVDENSGLCSTEETTCDGEDDDCDGRVDETIRRVCGSDVGRCETGVSTCVDGKMQICAGSAGPQDELCNNLDDDCDGRTDERVTRACGSNVGRCRSGTQNCASGSFGMCTGRVGSRSERCDNIDDDCDGRTDEGVSRACGTNVGRCRTGTQTCVTGGFRGCSGNIGPRAERNNGLDDDCDGRTDEGIPCENTYKREIRVATNNARRAYGAGNLACDLGLGRAAQAHAADMCRTGLFSHTSQDGSTLVNRLARARAIYNNAAENLAHASTRIGASALVGLWMDSPPHRANLLNASYGRIGIGYSNCRARGLRYWVQVFGD